MLITADCSASACAVSMALSEELFGVTVWRPPLTHPAKGTNKQRLRATAMQRKHPNSLRSGGFMRLM
jgi:hypothetical protein